MIWIPVLILSGFTDVSPQPVKYGTLSNACGPTDAPVIDLRLTDVEIQCSTGIGTVSHISAYLEFAYTQDLEVGMKVGPHSYGSSGPMPAIKCDIGFENCVTVGDVSLEFNGKGTDTLSGEYTFQNGDLTDTGDFVVKRCENQRPLCG